jgi:spermidine/putrescine transport system substrate-binding protein
MGDVSLKKTVLMILGLVVLSLVLTGCGKEQPVLYVYNWGDYIDESILEEFEKETGIKVVYDTFSTNEDMYVKIKSGGSTYDVVFPSDYMVTRMINEGMLLKIDLEKIPNRVHIDPKLMGADYDPKNEYTLPYMWGTLGILYNTTMVEGEVDSWDVLWDARYAKNILMLDSQRDSIGAALLKLGYSINTKDPQELAEAAELLKQQKPLVLAYVVDEGKDKMVAGEAALALTWSGEAMYAIGENPDLSYAIPKEGTNLWFDVMAIPKGAKNIEGAHKFMDFLNRPEIALRNAEYTGYSTPNLAAWEMLPEEVRNDPRAYPSEEVLANTEVFVSLGETLREYDRIWTEVKAF